MSKIITVTGRPATDSRSITRAQASVKPRRLSMPLRGSIDAAVLCTATARSDTIMKITNTVPIAYSTSSIENSVTQKLETKFWPFNRRRSPTRIGSIRTQPCATGITIASQRRCIARRRSLHSSEAVSAA
ncbi:hypothetical protein AB7M56_003475 [Bradyrhizobium elkanii]